MSSFSNLVASMTRFNTLSSKDIAATLQSGRRYRSRSLLVFVDPLSASSSENAESLSGKLAFIAPKRLGSAVLRNRCKRLLRAGMVSALGVVEVHDIYDKNNIILMATSRTIEVDSVQITEELAQIFDKVVRSEAIDVTT